jgi:hypothetical protein
MASVYTTPSVLTGLFKEIYGDSQISLLPDNAKLQKLIPFVSRDKELGNKYHQNVIVAYEHGFSYASADAGAFALNDHIGMQTQDAQVQGSQMLLRSALSYDAAARASNGKKAFAKATSMIVENMVESVAKRLEVAMVYGQCSNGLGNGDTGAIVGDSVTGSVTLTVDAAQWAPGIWQGMEGSKVACKVSTSFYGPFKIDSVDFDDRKIVLKAATETKGQDAGTGLIANIDSESDVKIFYFGSVQLSDGVSREMKGLENIITTSGSLFNINNSTYGLWKGNVATVTGQLTIGKILQALGKPISKGLDEDVVCLVNPETWSDLATDLAALRHFDQSYDPKKGENGVESLVYRSQNGKIDIVSHPCVKRGEAFVIPPKRFKRIGAIDVTFKTPGREEEIFFNLPDNAGFELRAYTDQALFPESPAKCLKITGIVNSIDAA